MACKTRGDDGRFARPERATRVTGPVKGSEVKRMNEGRVERVIKELGKR